MKLIIPVQGVRVDQKNQRGALPFVNGSHDTQSILVAAPGRQQCCIRQQLWPVAVQEAHAGRITAEVDEGSRYVSH